MKNSKLKVLHIITTIYGGGAENQLIQLVEETWPDVTHQVVALGPTDHIAHRYANANVDLTCLGLSKGIGGGLTGLARLFKIIRKSTPNILQTWMYHADLLGLLSALPFSRLPVIWYLQCSNVDFQLYGRTSHVVFNLCRALSKYPAAIAANSYSGADYHKRMGYPESIMRVISNGFATEHFKLDPVARNEIRERFGLGPEDLLVAHVGRFDPIKNHAMLFDAAAISAERNPFLHFVMFGKGVNKDNPSCAAAFRPPLAGRCHLMGAQRNIARWA
jgi:glycosyltransferase involved in cell wall biosynthesis